MLAPETAGTMTSGDFNIDRRQHSPTTHPAPSNRPSQTPNTTTTNMKFTFSFLLLALFATLCMAVAPQKQVIISFPQDTSAAVLDQIKAEIIKAVHMLHQVLTYKAID